MKMSEEEALQKAVDLLSARIKNHLELVDNIKGKAIYGMSENDIKDSWVFFVKSENMYLDGMQRYIIVDKKTGEAREIIAS